MASLVGKGGGLCERSVIASESIGRNGICDRCRSRARSVPSLFRADGTTSSEWRRPEKTPAQSPDAGRTSLNSGVVDKGVMAPA